MYQLQPVVERDGAALFAIHEAAIRPYVEQVWGWDDADQRVRFGEFLRSSASRLRWIVVDGERVGFLDWSMERDHVFIGNIELVPAHQGRGIGSRVVRDVVAQAAERGLPTRLQVLRVNNRARQLYARLGFVTTGTTETHVLMEWQLPLEEGRDGERISLGL